MNILSKSNNAIQISHKLKYKLFAFVAFLAGVAIPVSTSLQNISVALICALVLFDKDLRHSIKECVKNYFVLLSVFLYLMLLLWVFKSHAPSQDIMHMLSKMRIFILSPLLFVYFIRYESRLWAMYGYAVGAIITAIFSIFMCITRLKLTRSVNLGGNAGSFGDWAAFRYHTYHDYFLAVLVIGLLSVILYKQIDRTWVKWLWGIIAIVAIDILYLVQGRAGQILFLAMIVATVALWNFRKSILALFVMLCIVPVVIHTSPAVQGGINRIEQDMAQYNKGNKRTSVGARIEFAEYSQKLIAHSPIMGYGTGSFHYEYQKITGFTGEAAPKHPHNDFYWLWIEIGILGPLSILAITAASIYYGWKSKSPEGKLAIIVAISYMFGALQGGFYTDNISSAAYMVILSVLLAGNTFTKKLR